MTDRLLRAYPLPLAGLLLLVASCGSSATVRSDEAAAAPAAEPAAAPAPVEREPCSDLTVRFDADTTRVRADDRVPLHALADCVRDAERSVTISCHESGEGTEEYAFAASDRLVRAVAQEMADRGVTPDQLSGQAHGNALPLCREDTPACHARNRRCEIQFAY